MKSIWTRDLHEDGGRRIDGWSDLPPPTGWAKWFGGVAAPLALLGLSADAILSRVAVMHGDSSTTLDIRGADAVLYGATLAFGALFLHVHYFWGNSPRLAGLHGAGKTVSLTGFCAALFWLLFRIFRRDLTP